MLSPGVSFLGKSLHCMEGGEKKGTMQLVQGLFSGKKAPKLPYFYKKIV
jgi:hypothetical protein